MFSSDETSGIFTLYTAKDVKPAKKDEEEDSVGRQTLVSAIHTTAPDDVEMPTQQEQPQPRSMIGSTAVVVKNRPPRPPVETMSELQKTYSRIKKSNSSSNDNENDSASEPYADPFVLNGRPSVSEDTDDVDSLFDGIQTDVNLMTIANFHDDGASIISSLAADENSYIPWLIARYPFANVDTVGSVEGMESGEPNDPPSSPPTTDEEIPPPPTHADGGHDDTHNDGTSVFGGTYASILERINSNKKKKKSNASSPIQTYKPTTILPSRQTNANANLETVETVLGSSDAVDSDDAKTTDGTAKTTSAPSSNENSVDNDDEESSNSFVLGKQVSSKGDASLNASTSPDDSFVISGIYSSDLDMTRGILQSNSFQRIILALGCLVVICIALAVAGTLLVETGASGVVLKDQQIPLCRDDPAYFFQIGSTEQDCEWLAQQPQHTVEVLCKTLGDSTACLVTCNLCE